MLRIGIAAALAALAACGERAGDAPAQSDATTAQAGLHAPPEPYADGGLSNDFPARPAAQSAPLPPGVYRMQKVAIADPSGFGQPMTAARILIPAGWRAQGGVAWGALGQCGADYAFQWSAQSPDGGAGLSFLPAPNWSGLRSAYVSPQQQQGGCDTAFHRTARDYLQAMAARLFPGSRPLDYRPLPDDARPFQDALAQAPAYDVPGMRSRLTVDAGELLVAYQEGGREMRATLSVIALINETQFDDVANPGATMESVSGFPANLIVVRAPHGQLDFGLRALVMKSLRYDPEWSARIAQFNARKVRAATDAMTDGHNARMDALRKTSEIYNGLYKDRDLTSDRMQRESIEAIRGVETYHDIDGAPVQLDNTYAHAWRVTNDDSYILTSDPNFNPGLYNIEAQQLRVIQ